MDQAEATTLTFLFICMSLSYCEERVKNMLALSETTYRLQLQGKNLQPPHFLLKASFLKHVWIETIPFNMLWIFSLFNSQSTSVYLYKHI